MRTTNDDRPWVRLLRSDSVLSLTAKHLLQRYLWSSRMHSLLLGSLKVVSVRPAFPSTEIINAVDEEAALRSYLYHIALQVFMMEVLKRIISQHTKQCTHYDIVP